MTQSLIIHPRTLSRIAKRSALLLVCALLLLVPQLRANEGASDEAPTYAGPLDNSIDPPAAHDQPTMMPPPAVPDATVVEPGLHADIPEGESNPNKPLAATPEAESGKAVSLLGETVAPGILSTLQWSPQDMFEGIPVHTPVLVANGAFAGPKLCMTGAVHGDEINSIETIRRVMFGLDPKHLSGTVIGVPIVNQMGFRRSSRYLPDRRDLNRFFPGSATGSSAARIAHSLFHEVILHCDALIDLHTGSFYRTNIPQLRADLKQPRVRELADQFGNIVVLHSEGSPGMLRREATLANIPTVTLEAGESLRIQEGVIKQGVKHINALLGNMKMIKRGFAWGNPQPAYMASRWLRAESGGIFISRKKPGDKVGYGDKLGTITDPINNKETIVRAEFAGRILGMAMNQVVLPGYAIYHVGIDTSLVGNPLAAVVESEADTEVGEQGGVPAMHE
ncbi:MAG: succinylglutamate desuccinylase/aspartoacylase family protein [Pseudomonadales bacterium]|nr:succinylglutamate desuccinylase/aspartoacylase family protein [Pseudomonadales bacterium]